MNQFTINASFASGFTLLGETFYFDSIEILLDYLEEVTEDELTFFELLEDELQ